MLVRLGMFLGWLFNAAALLCAVPGVLLLLNQSGPLSKPDTIAVCGFFGIATAVWLLGRGIRFVFVGPKRMTAHEFVERFADPNVPVRLGPTPPVAPRSPARPRASVPTSSGAPRGPWEDAR